MLRTFTLSHIDNFHIFLKSGALNHTSNSDNPSVVANVEFKIQLRWFGALASKFQQVLKIIPKFSFSPG